MCWCRSVVQPRRVVGNAFSRFRCSLMREVRCHVDTASERVRFHILRQLNGLYSLGPARKGPQLCVSPPPHPTPAVTQYRTTAVRVRFHTHIAPTEWHLFIRTSKDTSPFVCALPSPLYPCRYPVPSHAHLVFLPRCQLTLIPLFSACLFVIGCAAGPRLAGMASVAGLGAVGVAYAVDKAAASVLGQGVIF